MGGEDDVSGGKDQAQAQAQARAPSQAQARAHSQAQAQGAFQIDINYEFSAPRYFDFLQGETSEEAHKAECWFKTACTYAASPFVPKIKPRRSFAFEALCSFQEAMQAEQLVAASLPPEYSKENGCTVPSSTANSYSTEMSKANSTESKDNVNSTESKDNVNSTESKDNVNSTEAKDNANSTESKDNAHQDINKAMEVYTPGAQVMPKVVSSKPSIAKSAGKKSSKQPNSGGNCGTEVKNARHAINRCIRSTSLKKENCAENSAAQENQAVKRQKLEAGRLRQILKIKEHILPHKTHPNRPANKESTASIYKNNERNWNSASKCRTSEQLHKQQSLSHDGTGAPSQNPRALMLTIPKDPGLETAQRSRPTRFKSVEELEEEMLAKIPKFKARPLNKKILEAPLLPPLHKTVPQLPEFQEFHLKTMERSLQHSSASSSTDSAVIPDKRRCESVTAVVLTEPRPPHLETSLRARPPKVKSSEELEEEELQKIPKFKARPLNKKIFCSKGDLGVFCNLKRQVTTPVGFHFATDERLPLPPPTEIFKKLSLNSEPHHDPVPRLTVPHPFHLLTEERGAEKEMKFVTQLLEGEEKEKEARIPKANPYPYTTDYPLIPPKPIPKECTKPEPFQLESLMRHEEELQRRMEELERIEWEEQERRKFRAQPILSSVPEHVPEVVPRKPLTEVHEFTFHADARALERAEFDQKVKEKENLYKRFREDYETAKKLEEERLVKRMRRTMVPHARPVPTFEKPFVPKRSSKELTKPKSPNLRVNHKERRQSMMSNKERKQSMTPSLQKNVQMR